MNAEFLSDKSLSGVGEKIFQINEQNEQEKNWLASLQSKYLEIRGPCLECEYRQFLTELRSLLRREFLDVSVVSVKDLLEWKESSTVDISVKCQEMARQNQRQIYRRILTGRFKFTPPTINDPQSHIHLQDNTGSITCKVTDSVRHSLLSAGENWCVLSSWRLVVAEAGAIYIKVKKLIQEQSAKKARRKICALSTPDVSVLLQQKGKLPTSGLNVFAEIRSISEVLRIKDDLVVLIELDNNVFIIIKDRVYLHWSELLSPQTEVVLTNLLPTTLYKGSQQEMRVLVPWKQSDILCPEMESITVLSLPDWLKQTPGISLSEQLTPLSCARQGELCTYKGEITNADLESFGIYQLDRTVWLILSGLPFTHYKEDLHLGTCLTIYNCHMCAFKEFPKICIIGCLSTSVRVTQFSSSQPLTRVLSPSVFIKNWLWRYSVSELTVFQFARFLISLNKKFKNILTCSQIDWILEKFATYRTDLPKRNYTKEFLATPHRCFMWKKESENKSAVFLPAVPACSDIVFDSAVIHRLGYNIIQNLRTVENLNTDLYWLHHCQEKDTVTVLMGYIHFCPDTGRVLLMDDTGGQRCLIMRGGDVGHCSLSALAGCLVAIKNYQVVFERFQICQYPNYDSYGKLKYIRNSSEDVYLMVSSSDVEILLKNKRPEEGSMDRVLCCVVHKESLLTEGISSGKPSLRFTAFGYFLDDTCSEVEIHDFVNDALGYWSERYRADDLMESDTEEQRQRASLMEHKILLFRDSAARWYEAIQPGHVYWFSSTEKLVPISTKHSLKLLKKAEKQAGGKTCIRVPSDLWVSEKLLSFKCQHKKCPLCKNTCVLSKISEIKKESFQYRMVSLEGRIKSRRHLSADNPLYRSRVNFPSDSTLCVSTLENRTICLTVTGEDPEEELVIYMTLNNISYPLGLLPGHVIRLCNLERKVSRQGSVYCQYVVISTVQVLEVQTQPPLTISEEKETKESLWERSSLHQLCEIWRQPDLSAMQCVCHIHKITTIALKSTCNNCSTVICNGQCENPLCDPGHGTKFSASACLFVDDGTSFATVRCYSNIVQKLLELSETEWFDLEEAVKQEGDIFMTASDDGSSVQQFLRVLREASHLHRQKNLLLKLDKHHTWQETFQDIDSASSSDFAMKTVDTGSGNLETRCLPMLQLICLDIREVDFTSYIMHNATFSANT
uniref:CST complex subunit CTC1 n=2 Tax=Crassostrea virginica TaxID=6565 RepID=A0A8B8E3E0_CRAVI|nr:CST complex subunit CTC1-like isoform X1 [Crassostrea virginica]